MRSTVNCYIIHFCDEYHSCIYHGYYFEVYRRTESPCYIIGTNIVLQVSRLWKLSKLIEIEISFVATRGREWEKGEQKRICLQCRRCGFNLWVWKTTPWQRARQPTPVFLPGKSHGQRRLVNNFILSICLKDNILIYLTQ